MNGKYLNSWIWLINIIIGVTLALIIGQKLLVGGEKSWSLAPNQMPEVTLAKSWGIGEYELKSEGNVVLRKPTDPDWRILSTLSINQLKLPPMPEPPAELPKVEPTKQADPTAEEALADLATKIKLTGIFAPDFAKADYLEAGISIIWIPRKRMLSDEYNIYNNLESLGLPAECVEVLSGGVRVNYKYRGIVFDVILRYIITVTLPDVIEEINEKVRNAPENVGKDGKDPKNPSKVKVPNAPPKYNPPSKTWDLPDEDRDYLKNNYSKEIAKLKTATYYNPETKKAEGIKVQEVPEDSMAKKYGVQSGDIILSINGNSVKTKNEAINYVKKNPDEPSYNVEFIRNGVRQTRSFKNSNR